MAVGSGAVFHDSRFSVILTSEQARICYDLVKKHRMAIVGKWKFGIWDGLLQSLSQIDRAGGAFLRSPLSSPFEYGGEIIEATIIPAYTYIGLLGISLPCPYWDLVARLPELSVEHHGQTMVWRPVNIYRTRTLLALIPLAVSALPADNPLQGVPP